MRLITAVVVTIVLAKSSLAQNPPYPDNSAEMKKISWLVGAWEAKSSDKRMGDCVHTYRIEWPSAKLIGHGAAKTPNHNFLRTSYTMRAGGRIVWSDFSMMGWDKDNKRYTWFVFGMDGTIGTSTAVTTKYDKDGNVVKLVMDGETTGNDPWKKHRIVILRVDANTMIQEFLSWQDGKYVAMEGMSKTTFKRRIAKKDATGDAPKKG